MDSLSQTKLIQSTAPLNREKFSRLKHTGGKNEDDKLKKACKEFEGLMLHEIMKGMRKTVPKGGIFPDSSRNNIWQSMYDEKISYKVAEVENGMGFAKFLYDQLSSGSKSD